MSTCIESRNAFYGVRQCHRQCAVALAVSCGRSRSGSKPVCGRDLESTGRACYVKVSGIWATAYSPRNAYTDSREDNWWLLHFRYLDKGKRRSGPGKKSLRLPESVDIRRPFSILYLSLLDGRANLDGREGDPRSRHLEMVPHLGRTVRRQRFS